MPRLDQVESAVDTLVLPQSGVRITIRREPTGTDQSDCISAVIGEGYNPRHSYNRYLTYMAATLMVEWDAQDKEGHPLPISPQEIRKIKDPADIEFLLNDIDKRITLRKEGNEPGAEGPFEMPSTASSPETSSTTLESSQAS